VEKDPLPPMLLTAASGIIAALHMPPPCLMRTSYPSLPPHFPSTHPSGVCAWICTVHLWVNAAEMVPTHPQTMHQHTLLSISCIQSTDLDVLPNNLNPHTHIGTSCLTKPNTPPAGSRDHAIELPNSTDPYPHASTRYLSISCLTTQPLACI
jgi:hypothetical protein